MHRSAVSASCALILLLSTSSGFTADACGSLHVKVHSEALPDNGAPPHDQTLDQTWKIVEGSKHDYVNSDGSIASQGYPSNGGSHSYEYLDTSCKVTSSKKVPWTIGLTINAKSDLRSGVGNGTGASSDYDTDWVISVSPPTKPRKATWKLSVSGTVQASNVSPNCSISLNSSQKKTLPTGPFTEIFSKIKKGDTVTFSCSQGHLAIFPTPADNATVTNVNSNVNLTFAR